MEFPKPKPPSKTLLDMPIGTPVWVVLDDGSHVETVTTSIPWQLGHGAWVVKSEATGASGFNLSRFTRKE